MKTVEITYRFDAAGAVGQADPVDSAAALNRMNEGNRAFAEMFAKPGEPTEVVERVVHLDPRDVGIQDCGDRTPEQRPFAAVLGCSDARVPIGLIFNEGANDLFVVRVAGNTLGDDVRGSLNYAIEHLGDSLRLLVVLGHSGCGAVTAAVDSFLNPSSYLELASKHAVRMVVDRLLINVHAAARRLEEAFGPEITRHPRYREALIEISVISNAALGAYTLQEQIGREGEMGIQTAYGAYGIAERTIWAPRSGGDEVVGLAKPPSDAAGFVEFGDAVLKSARISSLLRDSPSFPKG